MDYNVIICMLNSSYIHSGLAPWCLMSGIKKYGSDRICAKVLESTINEKSEKILSEILQYKPSVIGLCCYIWNIEKIKPLIKELKTALPSCKIVLGGPEVSYCAEKVLTENPLADYVICGEGERPFALLCDALLGECSKEALSSIPGLCYRFENGIHISDAHIEKCEVPMPYDEGYLESLDGRISYIEGSRGCPFSCAYCLSGRCGNVRYFDIAKTKENIIRLANSGTKTIKFVDRTFNADKKRAIEIWEFIASQYGKAIPRGVCVHFEIGGDLLSEECFSVLQRMPAGSIQLELGIQSFNEKTLKAIKRKTDTERLSANIQRLISLGNMHVHIDLIAGLPYEDFESFRESFNKAFELRANMLQLGFLKLLHGADMRENPEKYPCKYCSTAPYEVISTPHLTEDDMRKLKLVEHANDKISNSGKFSHSFGYILNTLDKTPFDILLEFGTYYNKHVEKTVSLFELSEIYYNYFSSYTQINPDTLSDMMILDFFSHSRYGKLPSFLKRQDKCIKAVLEYLSKNPKSKKKDGAVRSAAILHTRPVAVYCDSAQTPELDKEFKNPVTKKYELHFINLSEIFDV